MPENELQETLHAQHNELWLSWEQCLGAVTIFFNDNSTLPKLRETLEVHGAHLLDITQDFLGDKDLHDSSLLTNFVSAHASHHRNSIAKRLAATTMVRWVDPPGNIPHLSKSFANSTIETAAKDGNTNIIEEAHGFIMASIYGVLDATYSLPYRKTITTPVYSPSEFQAKKTLRPRPN